LDARERDVDEDQDLMLDQDIPQWLSDTAKENFLKLRSMFESDGWKLVMDFAGKKANEALLKGAEAVTWELNRVWHGQRRAWTDLATFETQVVNEFRQLAIQNRDANIDSGSDSPDGRHE
jgi:hypothetical protein